MNPHRHGDQLPACHNNLSGTSTVSSDAQDLHVGLVGHMSLVIVSDLVYLHAFPDDFHRSGADGPYGPASRRRPNVGRNLRRAVPAPPPSASSKRTGVSRGDRYIYDAGGVCLSNRNPEPPPAQRPTVRTNHGPKPPAMNAPPSGGTSKSSTRHRGGMAGVPGIVMPGHR